MRVETILAHLDYELASSAVRSSAMLQASIVPAIGADPDGLQSIVNELQDRLVDSLMLQLMMDPTPSDRDKPLTVDGRGLMKLYQAMIDAGFIKKAS